MKRRMNRFYQQAFTLIEVMIVVVIIGVLTMIAYPSYQDYIIRTRREECMSELLNFANAMEREYSRNLSYLQLATGPADTGQPAATTFPATDCPQDEATKGYDFTIDAATRTTYSLKADAIGPQATNGDFLVDQAGVRNWDKDNSDDDGAGVGENNWNRN